MTTLSSFNNEDLNLTILQEECAELIQIIAKIKRFGLKDFHPNTGRSNLDRLIQEVGDVQAMLDIVVNQYGIFNSSQGARLDKLDKLSRYYQYAPEGE